MMKKLAIFGAIGALGLLAACGRPVEVPPGYVAKLNTQSGLQEELIQPSKFRLEEMCVHCSNLIMLEASDRKVSEKMQIFIPKDQLNITVEVVATMAIDNKPATVNPIFSRIPSSPKVLKIDRNTREPTEYDDRISMITFDRIYSTYGEQALLETVRSTLTNYSIAQIMENRDAVSAELNQRIQEKLKPTPLTVLSFGLANVQFPDIIVRAKERAAEREAAIAEAENRKAIALKEQEIDLIEAETQMLVDKKLAEGVSKAFVSQRWLAIWEKMAGNEQKTIIVVTPEGIGDPNVMMPTLNRAIGGN